MKLMEQKQLIIIGAICVVICILGGAIFGILTHTVNYEKIELTANGTTMEIPTNNATYQGVINDTGIKLWTFNQGRLISFNSEEAISGNGLYGLAGAVAFKDVKDLIYNHFKKQERVDDFIVYTLDANVMDPDGKGDIYCILLTNNETHDNIVIVAGTQDIALHMAKSVEYKALNITEEDNATTSSSSSSGSSGVSKTAPTKNSSNVDSSDLKGEDYWLSLEGKAYEVDDCPGAVYDESSSSSSSSSDSNPSVETSSAVDTK